MKDCELSDFAGLAVPVLPHHTRTPEPSNETLSRISEARYEWGAVERAHGDLFNGSDAGLAHFRGPCYWECRIWGFRVQRAGFQVAWLDYIAASKKSWPLFGGPYIKNCSQLGLY